MKEFKTNPAFAITDEQLLRRHYAATHDLAVKKM
jgi:hypothetical protein